MPTLRCANSSRPSYNEMTLSPCARYTESVGMMKFQMYGKNDHHHPNINLCIPYINVCKVMFQDVPNHQAACRIHYDLPSMFSDDLLHHGRDPRSPLETSHSPTALRGTSHSGFMASPGGKHMWIYLQK